ncbi:hypothetical protein ES703_08512 [subsurface metagenome]
MRQKGREKRATLNISATTKDALDSVKHPRQSYDGVIQELIAIRKKLLHAGLLPGEELLRSPGQKPE